jgi:hypothetical protein
MSKKILQISRSLVLKNNKKLEFMTCKYMGKYMGENVELDGSLTDKNHSNFTSFHFLSVLQKSESQTFAQCKNCPCYTNSPTSRTGLRDRPWLATMGGKWYLHCEKI